MSDHHLYFAFRVGTSLFHWRIASFQRPGASMARVGYIAGTGEKVCWKPPELTFDVHESGPFERAIERAKSIGFDVEDCELDSECLRDQSLNEIVIATSIDAPRYQRVRMTLDLKEK